jgi:hypothetical protein
MVGAFLGACVGAVVLAVLTSGTRPPPALRFDLLKHMRAGTQELPVRCLKCEHEWTETTLTGVRVSVWIKHVRTLVCPECGASWRKIALRVRGAKATGSTESAGGAIGETNGGA